MTTLPPTYKSSIERVPWQAPEPGSPGYTKPCWRYTAWGRVETPQGSYDKITALIHVDTLKEALSYADWRVIPFRTDIDAAIKALGGKSAVEATRATCRDPGNTHRLVIEAHRITALVRATGELMEWRGPVDGWKPAGGDPP